MISVTIPIRTVSEANAHEHWRVRQRRAKQQRETARIVLANVVSSAPTRYAGLPLIVTLTRIAPRALDSDNLSGSQKHIRDGVADWLGIDDRDPRIEWRYAQERGAPKTYAVRIEVSP